jgi:hypothetical protein
MRDIDLSSEVKIFPTSFDGARFVPYPPYRKEKNAWVNEKWTSKEKEISDIEQSKDNLKKVWPYLLVSAYPFLQGRK